MEADCAAKGKVALCCEGIPFIKHGVKAYRFNCDVEVGATIFGKDMQR